MTEKWSGSRQASAAEKFDRLEDQELKELLEGLGLSEDSARREYQGVLDRFNSLTSWQAGMVARHAP